MLKIGITGNIASGKSEVEKIISSFGFLVVDLDIVSHKLLENDEEIKSAIFNEFQTLERKKIANIVFNNKEKLEKLNNIFHPILKKYILNLFNEASSTVFVSGALIYEAGFNNLFDKIIFVDSAYETRLERLIKRNNLTVEEAKIRLEKQNTKFKDKADFIVENDGDIGELKEKIQKILEVL